MKVSLFLLADYANLTEDGKLNIMGLFNIIYSSNFPTQHPQMAIVAKLKAELGEDGQTRDIRVALFSPDGKKLLEVGGAMQFPQRASGQNPEINAIITLQNVVFPEPGPYSFVLFVDKDNKDNLSLSVVNATRPDSAQS